jgi:hypothetical protein
MTVTSPPPGIPGASRLVGWIGGGLGREPAEVEDIQLIAGGRSNLSGRLTVVLEGIYARYSQHQTVGEGFEHEGLAVPTLVARAHQVLDADD